MNVRLGSLTKYGQTIDSLFRWLYKLVGSRIILCIENNSIGKAIVEHLLYHVQDIDYTSFIYREKDKDGKPKDEFGIATNTGSKELMVSLLYDSIKDRPDSLHSQNFIGQLSGIIRTARGTIKSSSYSDMFMAAAFCAYVRKLTSLDILPRLNYSNEQLQVGFYNTIKTAAEMMNTRLLINDADKRSNSSNLIRTAKEDEMITTQMYTDVKKDEEDNDWRIYMPIFME